MNAPEVIITTDRTMMSNHHGKEFLGFIATGPAIGLPERIWEWISSPKPKILNDGEPLEAPYGLRKVEAALIQNGINAKIVDPAYLYKYVNTTKVLLIGHHDYFAYGPPSNEWWLLTGKEPINRKSFIKLMQSSAIEKMRRNGVKIIVGGPAAWQWLYERELWQKLGITTVFDGEAEKVLPDIVNDILNNKNVPFYVYVGVKDVPSIDEIPTILKPSVNGLVEIMRGCPRGCRFCSVTLRPLRYIPLEKIEKEILVNYKNGIKSILFHSEDVPLYYANGVKPNPDAVIKLHQLAIKYANNIGWSHASLSAIKFSEENYKMISTIMDLIRKKQEYLGVEVGIETGGKKLAKKIMPAKAAPYDISRWHEVVEDAFSIMHENRIIPAATVILGLPDETEDDVIETIELIEKLRPYRSLIVPMLFVPMGYLKNQQMFEKKMLKDYHIELMYVIYKHSIYWAYDIMSKFYLRSYKYEPLKILLKFFMHYANSKIEKYAEAKGIKSSL